MSRTTVAVSSFLVLAFSASMAAEVSLSAANLSAEEVVTRNVAARGGLQPWRSIQTLSMSGKMDAGGNEASTRIAAQGSKLGGVQLPKRPKEQAQLPFRMELKRNRKSRLKLIFAARPPSRSTTVPRAGNYARTSIGTK